MNKEYVLKHKEIPVVTFRMNEENYELLGIIKYWMLKGFHFQ